MLQDDLDYMIADLPATLTWDSQSITCTRTEVNKADDVEDEGIFQNADLEVVCSVDDFSGSTLPDNRTVVEVDGVNYYIASQVPSQDGIAVTFSLMRT